MVTFHSTPECEEIEEQLVPHKVQVTLEDGSAAVIELPDVDEEGIAFVGVPLPHRPVPSEAHDVPQPDVD